ncbi:MAG: response regulator transcription factor [Defluviitaleaceae bacterium]|nr:response regulator transcription factor [Defluviitaleaceae bacterium]
MSKIVYILEDDEAILELIEYTLSSSGFESVSFGNPTDFFVGLNERLPHIILLDIMLSGSKTGLDVIKRLKANNDTKNIPVIFVTSKSSEIDKAHGLDIGADDYITKPFGVLELIARVKAVLRRFNESTEPIKEIPYKDLLLNTQSKQLFKGGKEINLTFKEYELFAHLYENVGVAISRDSLLDNVWGLDFFGERRTVDVHIRSLRQKLEDNAEKPKYIKTIRGYGYMLAKE